MSTLPKIFRCAIVAVLVGNAACATLLAQPKAAIRRWTKPYEWQRIELVGAEDDEDGVKYSAAWPSENFVCRLPANPASLAAAKTPRVAVVLVHGIGGAGDEWQNAIPGLSGLKPAEMYMFHWKPHGTRKELTTAFTEGLNRVACGAETDRILVIAHSAGGVVASLAAAGLSPMGKPVKILTVASPLAGTGHRRTDKPPSAEQQLVMGMGGTEQLYPSPAKGVEVVHLRTRAPADTVMQPGVGGHLPNDPSVGVQGARQVDLPVSLTHDASIRHVIEQLANGEGFGDAEQK